MADVGAADGERVEVAFGGNLDGYCLCAAPTAVLAALDEKEPMFTTQRARALLSCSTILNK